MKKKEEKVFKDYCYSISWWEKILLLFCKRIYSYDLEPSGAVFTVVMKKLFGRIYIIDAYNEIFL